MTTPNYEINLPTDDDSMADTDFSFNDAWTIIESIPTCTTWASLPITDFSYSVGDKIYHSGLKSIFILIAQNGFWGNFWRPINVKYGPWVAPGSNIISDPSVYQFGTTPINYKISNTGKFILRGSVDTVASTGYVNAEIGFSSAGLVPIPSSIAPSKRSVYAGAAYPATASTTKPAFAQIAISPSGSFSNVVWNSFNTCTSLFYDGWEWVMGYGGGYGPNA